jgi:hypothetical protein
VGEGISEVFERLCGGSAGEDIDRPIILILAGLRFLALLARCRTISLALVRLLLGGEMLLAEEDIVLRELLLGRCCCRCCMRGCCGRRLSRRTAL